MKKLLFLGVLGFCFLGLSAQNVQSNAYGTSGGFGAGLSADSSTFYGTSAGSVNNQRSSSGNTFIGHNSGKLNNSGSGNTFLGKESGENNITGFGNTYLGISSGRSLIGSKNVVIGHNAGSGSFTNLSSRNIFIGCDTGFISNGNLVTISDQLFIDNTLNNTPLIWGDFAQDQLKLNGKVGIGNVTTFPTTAGTVNVSNYKLFVTGGVLTDEVRVNLSNAGAWADYVFAKNYKLPTLTEVETQIQTKGHLANMPSAKEVAANGIELGQMAKLQQEKIEELTLYIIEQNKTNEKQGKDIEALKALVKTLVEKNK